MSEHRPIQPKPDGEREIYEIEPEPTPRPGSGELLEGFDEEELEELEGVEKPAGAKPPEEEEAGPKPMADSKGVPPRILVIVSGLLVVGALITSVVLSDGAPILGALLTLYRIGAHFVIGTLALAGVAAMLGRKVGSVPDALARMFAAVALFAIVCQIPLEWTAIPPLGGAAAYFLALWSLFRWDRETLLTVAGAQLVLSLLLELGLLLASEHRVARIPEAAIWLLSI